MSIISRRDFLRSGSILALSASMGIFNFTVGCSTDDSTTEKKHALILSDIHFNPFIYKDESSAGELLDALMAEDYDNWLREFEQHGPEDLGELLRDGHSTGTETNFRLLDETIKKMHNEYDEDNIEFIFITGDILCHSYIRRFISLYHDIYGSENDPVNDREMVQKALCYVSHSFNLYFKNIPIYFCIGNNDGYCHDFGKDEHLYKSSYASKYNDIFFENTCDNFYTNYIKGHIASDDFKEHFETPFKKWGAYNLAMPGNGNRIISINTNFFSKKRRDWNNPWDGAQEQLDWLEIQLADAQANNQSVWLLGHIPPGIQSSSLFYYDDTPCNFNKQLVTLLSNYGESLRVMFSGHTHMDEFRVYMDTEDQNKSFFVHVTPSVSPQYSNNPSYTAFTYNERYQIAGIDYHYIPFKEDGPTTDAQWNSYSFSSKYPDAAGDYCALTLHQIWQNLYSTSDPDTEAYVNHFNVLSPCPSNARNTMEDPSKTHRAACRAGNLFKDKFDDCAGNETAETFYYPHFDTSDGWRSEIRVVNTSSSRTAKGTLAFIFDNCPTIYKDCEIKPLACLHFNVATECAQSGSGYAVFTAENADDISGYTLFKKGGQAAAVPAMRPGLSSKRHISHIAADSEEECETWWTGIAMVNTADSAQTVTIYGNKPGNGNIPAPSRSIELGAGGHSFVTLEELFGFDYVGMETAEIHDAEDIVCLELFGHKEGDMELGGIRALGDTSPYLFFPQGFWDEDWWTEAVITNPYSENAHAVIHAYAKDGSLLSRENRSVEAGKTLTWRFSEHEKTLPENTAWFSVRSDISLTGFQVIGREDQDAMGGFSALGIHGTQRHILALHSGDDTKTYMAVVNTEDDEASMTINAVNEEGESLVSMLLELSPHAKAEGYADNFLGKDLSAAMHVQITSNQKIAAYQLAVKKDNSFAYGLPAM